VIFYDPAYATNKNFALCTCFPFASIVSNKALADITKHFWTFKHFGNFVKRTPNSFSYVLLQFMRHAAGSQRRALSGSDTQQWYLAVSTSTTYSVLAMNPNATDTTLTLTFPETVCSTSAFRTSGTEDFATVTAATAQSSNWLLPLRTMSLTTYTFKRGAC
jgi:hypothetical protein